ncbi:antitoxin Xre/MbcA/ParS toxin-binding domain-containing protein [Dyella silvae]|uniref:antitoxin Xre/MbcA/ParS toxin-binding domain-containing protein n=1 Tax=Dyella silvae TaxID=2994424 RepID=UPI002263C3CB|nr:antitoxin Xre/MbcA/ParS toxin-binding domain-containing protein [Dyella silvae]
MRKVTIRFQDVATELAQINAQRDDVMERAFVMLELRQGTLATMLVQSLGDRQRAVRWMCRHQNAFAGRTAYELLADGEEDTVWDEIALMSDAPVAARLNSVRMAY